MPATNKNKKIRKGVRRKRSRVVRATLLFVFLPKNKTGNSGDRIERKYLSGPTDNSALLDSFFKKSEKSCVIKEEGRKKDEL